MAAPLGTLLEVSLFRVAWRFVTSQHVSTNVITCRKLWLHPCSLRGRHSILDVSRCLLFLRIALSGLCHVVATCKVKIPWQAWPFVTCAGN